ncbi:hypothetical protein DFH29DRAFT_1009735 [Suillus ampliporus]|nr:hypothetical protein DFH29DRAFT_1009735 [Suillus ampliporus]
MRVTTVPEDIAYSLFGIFGVQLPILYGENKHNALERLLQEIVARSGDITVLDWADGLHDLLVTTEEKLIQFSRRRPIRQTFLLVRTWDRHLLQLPTFADDEPKTPIDDESGASPVEQALVDSQSHS